MEFSGATSMIHATTEWSAHRTEAMPGPDVPILDPHAVFVSAKESVLNRGKDEVSETTENTKKHIQKKVDEEVDRQVEEAKTSATDTAKQKAGDFIAKLPFIGDDSDNG